MREQPSTDTTPADLAIAEQLVVQYRKADSAASRIAEANLDLVVFGGMLVQLEEELRRSDGPKRGRGAFGLKNWMEIHTPTIPRTRAIELRSLAEAIANRWKLDTGTLQNLLTSPDGAKLPTGLSTKRKQILEDLGAGSLHRLHMEYGVRSHGGKRVAAEKPAPKAQTLEERRENSFRILGRCVSDLQLQVETRELFVDWLTADQLDAIALNVERVATSLRDSARTMRAADNPKGRS